MGITRRNHRLKSANVAVLWSLDIGRPTVPTCSSYQLLVPAYPACRMSSFSPHVFHHLLVRQLARKLCSAIRCLKHPVQADLKRFSTQVGTFSIHGMLQVLLGWPYRNFCGDSCCPVERFPRIGTTLYHSVALKRTMVDRYPSPTITTTNCSLHPHPIYITTAGQHSYQPHEPIYIYINTSIAGIYQPTTCLNHIY